MFWGLTPALDLLDQYLAHNEAPQELNILLVGSADARHVLQTLARRYRHRPSPKLTFFIAEACVETIAKQLLLLNIALQHSSVMGLIPKTKYFMELYGNTLVRPSVAKYLANAAQELIKMVTDYTYLQKVMPFVTIDVKYKERDHLENLLKFWCGRDDFDICTIWDQRLRKSLGVRYDSKLGAFDWDLHMRLHSVGGSQVCGQEYRNFRLTGAAFTWLESEVTKPNRSMVCVVVPNGESFVHYGYLGDIQTGPFVSYGVWCEDVEFLKASNGQNLYRATDVTERNLCQIFDEIQFGERYQHRGTSDLKLGPVVMQMGEKRVVDIKASHGNVKKSSKCVELPGVRIKFISLSALQTMKYKKEYEEFFDMAYFGSSYVKHLDGEFINSVLHPCGVLLVENQKYVLSLRDKQLQEFANDIRKAVEGAGVKQMAFDPCKDDFAKFVKEERKE